MQFVFVCLGTLLFSSQVFSQGSQGRITGTITDQTGGAISGATVTVLDVQRGVSRTLTTGDTGEYNAPNLLPGGNFIVQPGAIGEEIQVIRGRGAAGKGQLHQRRLGG